MRACDVRACAQVRQKGQKQEEFSETTGGIASRQEFNQRGEKNENMPACPRTYADSEVHTRTHTNRHKHPGHEHQPSTCISAQQ